MTNPLEPMPPDELEAALADLRTAVVFPATPDLAMAVASRLRTPTPTLKSRPRVVLFRRRASAAALVGAHATERFPGTLQLPSIFGARPLHRVPARPP